MAAAEAAIVAAPATAIAVPAALGSGFMNNGQACVAQTRILAPRDRYSEVVEALAVKLGVAATTNDGEVALDWALQGLGILQRSEWHVAPYLRSGRLQTVLPGWQMPGADIHAVYPARKNLSAKVVAFVEHLSERFAPLRQAGPEDLLLNTVNGPSPRSVSSSPAAWTAATRAAATCSSATVSWRTRR